jgi:uroporphyrinogen decarboxylase
LITSFANYVLASPRRLAMPIGVYAGLELTGANLRDAVSDPQAQAEAVLALHARFATSVLLTAMDLSAEAEAFGCAIRMSEDEIPTVVGRRASTLAEIRSLPSPTPGDRRTRVHLEAAHALVTHGDAPVLGGMIGPFSLAGRIFGVSEALEATIADPALIFELLEKTTNFLAAYAAAFREAGASGVIMAEPAAGLLSPRGLATFSTPFVQRIVSAAQTKDFAVVYHNCGARLAHLPRILESGAEVYHFGEPMDLPAALQLADGQYILCGNLSPTAVFHDGSPGQVRQATMSLLAACQAHPNFVISSGCDLPPHTPLDNLAAFFDAVAAFNPL